jgi:hypothetical protein
VGNIAGGLEARCGEAAAHAGKVFGAARHDVADRCVPIWGENEIRPVGIEVAVVPADVLIHHRLGGGVGRYVFDQAFAEDVDLAAVAQRLAVF